MYRFNNVIILIRTIVFAACMDKRELGNFLNNFLLWFPGTHFRREWAKGIPKAEKIFHDLDMIIAKEEFDLVAFNEVYARYKKANQQYTNYNMKIIRRRGSTAPSMVNPSEDE